MPHQPINTELNAAFRQLDAVLAASQNLWGPQPFINDDLPWFHSHPHLKEALLALSTDKALELHNNQQRRIGWFHELEATLCEQLFAFEPLPITTATPLTTTRFDSIGISGRKWEQITAFASALPRADSPLVDWCAGKGHLSRMVQRSQHQPVHCLEWDKTLVRDGRELASKQQLDIHYHHHDVMQPPPPPATIVPTSISASMPAANYMYNCLNTPLSATPKVSPCHPAATTKLLPRFINRCPKPRKKPL
nr:SAM-dependent methyltransferase [Oceanicoccus sp. KOV_DT_Chl]